jgi:DnaK suppressor protein
MLLSIPESPIDPETMARLRLRLEQERERLIEALEIETRPPDPLDRGEPGDDADLTVRHGLDDVDQALHRQHHEMLQAVKNAISRMEAGTYGINLATGEPIPIDRLEAVPWATY